MRAVLDANVFVSALIRPQGPSGQILNRLLLDHAFELVASRPTLEELRRSLGYPKVRKYLALSDRDLDVWVESLAALAVLVEGRVSGRFVEADPADDIYIAAAVEGLAECIVTGDRHLLDIEDHEGIRIVTPRAFLSGLKGVETPLPRIANSPPKVPAPTFTHASAGNQPVSRSERRRHSFQRASRNLASRR